MTVIYTGSLRSTRMTAVLNAINGGSINLYTSGDVLLGTLALGNPCGTVVGDVLTFGSIQNESSAKATGTATKATISNSSNVVQVSGLTVGLTGSGANLTLQSTSVNAQDVIAITSGSLTHNTLG